MTNRALEGEIYPAEFNLIYYGLERFRVPDTSRPPVSDDEVVVHRSVVDPEGNISGLQINTGAGGLERSSASINFEWIIPKER